MTHWSRLVWLGVSGLLVLLSPHVYAEDAPGKTQPKTRRQDPPHSPARKAPASRPSTSPRRPTSPPTPRMRPTPPPTPRMRPTRRTPTTQAPPARKASPRPPTKPVSRQRLVRLKGFVLERGRREPLEGAGIFIKALRMGIYADKQGRYSLSLKPGHYDVIVKLIGFLTIKKTLKLNKDTEHTFYLLPDPNNPLQSVLREQRVKKTSQQVSFQRTEMERMPGALGGDPFRAFQNFPGVARAARVNGDMIVRGASFADTGFYIDGHSIPILYHFGAGLTVVNRNFLQSVAFYPGGAPLSYGRFSAGLISAESRKAQATQIHGEINVSFAAFAFYLEVPLTAHWTIAAAATRTYVDAIVSWISKDSLETHLWDYQLKATYQTRHHYLSFFVFGSDDYINYAGLDKGSEVPLIGRVANKTNLRFLRLIAKYQYDRGPLFFRISVASGFTQDAKTIPTEARDLWDWPVEMRIDLRLQLHKTLRLDTGFDGLWSYRTYKYTQPEDPVSGFPQPVDAPFTSRLDATDTLLAPALYLNLRWKPLPRLLFQLGARGDLFLHEGQLLLSTDPRFSSTIRVHKHLKILASAGLYHRPPRPDVWSAIRGNPDLKLQRAFQTAAGVEYAPSKQLKIRAQGFYSHMFQVITPSQRILNDGDVPRFERYNNGGEGRAYGMELLVRLRLFKRLFGWVSYTLSRSERRASPEASYKLFEFDQPHIFNLMLLWRIGSGWSLNARFRLASGNPTNTLVRTTYDADTDNYRPVFDATKTSRYPLFHQLDLRVDKEWVFNTWTFAVYLDIHNLYNARNAEEYRYNYNYTKLESASGLPFFPAFGVRGRF